MLRIPEKLKQPMAGWREGCGPIPQGYIDFHAGCAQRDLDLRPDWKVVEDRGLVDDGWMDGFRVRCVIAAVPAPEALEGRKLVVLKWHESGAWFRDTGHGHVNEYPTLLDDHGRAPKPEEVPADPAAPYGESRVEDPEMAAIEAEWGDDPMGAWHGRNE